MTDNFRAMLDGWRSIADSDGCAGTPVGRALLDACNEAEHQRAEVERLRAELAKTCEERDDNWAAFRRMCKAGEIAEGHMDLMAQMRDSERARADALVAERDALMAAIEQVETDAIEQQHQTGTTTDRWKLGVYAQASRTRRILRAALDAPETRAEEGDQWRRDEQEIDGAFSGSEFPRLWPPRRRPETLGNSAESHENGRIPQTQGASEADGANEAQEGSQ